MNYLGYVIAAYAMFVAVLLWDFVVPKMQLRRELRTVRLRAARESESNDRVTGSPLSRG